MVTFFNSEEDIFETDITKMYFLRKPTIVMDVRVDEKKKEEDYRFDACLSSIKNYCQASR